MSPLFSIEMRTHPASSLYQSLCYLAPLYFDALSGLVILQRGARRSGDSSYINLYERSYKNNFFTLEKLLLFLILVETSGLSNILRNFFVSLISE